MELVVTSGDGDSATSPLPLSGEVVIGRMASCGI